MTEKFAEAFKQSERPHILMVTNHGIHQWDVIPGLPDTGGQNMFVNQLSATLAWLGFRITIANRGGYPHLHSAFLIVNSSFEFPSVARWVNVL